MGAFGISKGGPLYIRKQVKQQRYRRMGMTRKQLLPLVFGVRVRAVTSPPVIVRERWIRDPFKATYHATVIRFMVEDELGRRWTVKQGRIYNASDGYMVSVTGLYGIRPA